MKNGGKCRRYFLSVSRSGQRKIAKKPLKFPKNKDNQIILIIFLSLFFIIIWMKSK